MSRSLHASTTAIIGNTDLHVFHLITFNFSTPFRLTDHVHDLNYNFGSGTETFQATGRLKTLSNLSEQIEINNQTINLILTGANTADIALAFSENYNNEQVIIRRGFFDSTGETTDANIIADPFIIFDGRIDSFEIVDDPSSGESALTWKIASHWADWEKISGRRCNPQSAKLTFPNEEGFSHTYDQIGGRTWGRVRS